MRNWKLILTIITMSLIILFSIGYLDFIIITPLILPEDYCYYHTHEIPWWVELFYMTPANNDHPEGSFFHLVVLLIISIFLGYKLSKTIFNKRKI